MEIFIAIWAADRKAAEWSLYEKLPWEKRGKMISMKKYDYIFWDLDGTIADTQEGVSNCVRYAMEPYGIEIAQEDMRKFIGPPMRWSFPRYCGLTEEQTEKAIARYRERYIPVGVYECRMYPGVKDTLEKFRDAGRVQVLASSKPEGQCLDILKRFGILALFDEVVGARPDGKIDSKIQVLEEAFRRMALRNADFDKEKTVLIGDTRYDAAGAAEAGIDCLGVAYGFGTADELRSSGALAVFADLKELRDAVLSPPEPRQTQ